MALHTPPSEFHFRMHATRQSNFGRYSESEECIQLKIIHLTIIDPRTFHPYGLIERQGPYGLGFQGIELPRSDKVVLHVWRISTAQAKYKPR